LLFWPHQNPTGLGLYPTLTVGWSLNFEMFFYVLLTMALALVGRGWFWTTVVVLLLLPSICNPDDFGAAIAGNGLIRLFAWGMLLSHFFVRQGRSEDLKNGARRRFVFWLVLVLCVACLLGRPLPFLWRVEPLLMQVLASALVWTFVINESWIRHWPGAQVWRYLGDASYSTYLLHTAAMFLLLGLVPAASGWSLHPGFLVAYLLLTAMLSHLSFRVVESGPGMRWLQRRLLAKFAKG
jgi:exopolysaccharide production protein ExoZ